MKSIFYPKATKSIIGRKLIAVIIISSTLITLVTTAFQLWIDYRSDVKGIHESFESIRVSQLKTIRHSLWNFDSKTIQIMLNSLLKTEGIEYLKVVSNEMETWEAGRIQSRRTINMVFPIFYSEETKTRVGELEVVASLDQVYHRLLTKALIILLSNSVKTFLVVIVAVITFHRLVSRHLYVIGSHIKSLDRKNEDLILDRKRLNTDHPDEIDMIVSSLNTYQFQQKKTLDELRREIEIRKEAQDKLSESEDRFRSIFEEGPMGMTMSDVGNNTFISVNNAFCEMLGYTEEELKLKKVPEVTHPDFHDQDMEAMEALSCGTIRKHTTEKRYLRKDGEAVWAVRSLTILLDANGKSTYAVTMVKDISERKKAEELTITSLKEKETLLQELYHRTKNNMEVIRSMLMLQASKSSNEQVHELVRATESRIRAMSLVHQKLYQSKDLSQLSTRDYIEDLAKLLIRGFNDTSGAVKLRLDIEDMKMLIDTAIPLGLVLNELITNSLKHAFPSPQEGEISIRLSRENSGRIRLEFADNGTGVGNSFDYHPQDSLGFRLITGIVERQLDGTIQYESEDGFRCHIEFSNSLYDERV